MFVNILVLLIIFASTDALHTRMTRGSPFFVLNASETNPSLIDYKRDGIPFGIHWSAHETPYDTTKTIHDFRIKPNNEVNRVDSSNLVKGTYIFQLYTSNYMDGSVTKSHHTVIIMDDPKTSSPLPRLARVISTRICFLSFIALIRGPIRLLHNTIHTILVFSQYIGDRYSTYNEMVSNITIVMWDIVDIDTSHYILLAKLPDTKETMMQFHREHTLADYFSRNNAHYLEYVEYFYRIVM